MRGIRVKDIKDTDVFVFLLHFNCQSDIPASICVLTTWLIHGRTMIIDVNATVSQSQHRKILLDLLATYEPIGHDTVATYSVLWNWKGRGTQSPEIKCSCPNLQKMTPLSQSLSEFTSQVMPFIWLVTDSAKHWKACQKIWASIVSRNVAGVSGRLKLASLPSTNEALQENVARAHLQMAICRNALQSDPPRMDLVEWIVMERKFWNTFPQTLLSDTPLTSSGVHHAAVRHLAGHTDVVATVQTLHGPCYVHMSEWSGMFKWNNKAAYTGRRWWRRYLVNHHAD